MLVLILSLGLGCNRKRPPPPPPPPGVPFDVLLSAANDLEVMRLRFEPGYREQGPSTVWLWHTQDDFVHPHRPHGLSVDGDRVLVSLYDYNTDAFNLALDLETGEVVQTITTASAAPSGGLPERESERSTHNIIRAPGGGYILSDTHNHRVSGLNAEGVFQWELSQSTIWRAGYVQSRFANPNDVELVEVDGEPRLMVSTRGDQFNHILWFRPGQTVRPEDPPWELDFIFPERDTPTQMRQNHNPVVLEDGSGFVVANSYFDRIDAYDWEGTLIWRFPAADCEDTDSLNWPRGFAWTPSGTLLIADSSGDRLIEVDLEARCLDEGLLWSMDGVSATYDVLVLP